MKSIKPPKQDFSFKTFLTSFSRRCSHSPFFFPLQPFELKICRYLYNILVKITYKLACLDASYCPFILNFHNICHLLDAKPHLQYRVGHWTVLVLFLFCFFVFFYFLTVFLDKMHVQKPFMKRNYIVSCFVIFGRSLH